MKLVITIYFDNSAFNGRDCGRELACILQIVTGRVDLESKSDLIRGYHDDPKSLFDINGNRVGSMEIADDGAAGVEVDPCPYSERSSVCRTEARRMQSRCTWKGARRRLRPL